MERHLMMSLELARANVDALRHEARMSRGHDGISTRQRLRSLTGRRRAH